MKIQCDMCEKKEAAVYCTADEASLCHGCDRRVHHANKLANKHARFSLNPSSDQPTRCDICQERRAFLFCKEDRAILCTECDISIHSTNEHTRNHNRFLLAGVKLSESSSCYDSSSDQTLCSSNSIGSTKSDSRKRSIDQNTRAAANNFTDHCNGEGGSMEMEASSISQYLMETLPGWHVDEFLDPYGFYEGYDSYNNGDLGCVWSDDLGVGVCSSVGMVMDDEKSNTSSFSFSKRRMMNGAESLKKLNKEKHTSSIARQRQLW